MRAISTLAFAVLVAGCGGGGTTETGDMSKGTSPDLTMSMSMGDMSMMMSGGDMAMMSSGDGGGGPCCGQPGDKGNENGVGKYCMSGTDCMGTNAYLCAVIGDPKLHFCTLLCTKGNDAPCGTGATCQCNNSACACFPNACAGMDPSC
jgi:hypothetical protein